MKFLIKYEQNVENNTSKCEVKYSIYVDFYLKNAEIKNCILNKRLPLRRSWKVNEMYQDYR